MAQIIKHRRGSIGSLKGTTARNAELIVASGSISDLSGPFVFIGSPNSSDEGVAGAFNTISKLYNGNAAPTINAATYGSGLDGTPFYASSDKSLYILNNSNVGNYKVDLTGNIEGNTISAVTINNLTASYVSGAFIGDGTSLYNIPASGITGLNLAKIYSGSVQVTTDSVTGNVEVYATNNVNITGNSISQTVEGGEFYAHMADNSSDLYLSTNYAEMVAQDQIYINSYNYLNIEVNEGESGLYLDANSANLYTYTGDLQINAYNDGTAYSVNISGSLDVNVTGSNAVNLYGNAITAYGNTNTEIGQFDGSGYFYTSQNYSEMYAEDQIYINTENSISYINIEVNDGTSGIYFDTGSVALYAYYGASAYIWSDNYVYITGSAGISVYGNTAFTGSVNVSGNTSVTGSFVVTDGAAFIDQGVVAQNSNVLLTSGSSLIIQDGGNANIAGNVYITGSEYVDNIYGYTSGSSYLAFNNGPVGAPGVELGSGGNISLWAEGGYVNVTGSLVVTGDIVFSGSINIGDNLGQDTINFQGEVSSSIIPKVNNAFDLGSVDNAWHDLYVSGTAHIGVLDAGSISLSGITVFQDLQVSGSIFNYTLSPNDVVFVDGDQRLTGSANFQYNGSALYLNDYETFYVNNIYGNNSDYLDINADGQTWINSYSDTYVEYNEGDSGLYLSGNSAEAAELWSYVGDVNIKTYNGTGTYDINIDSVQNVNITGSNNINVMAGNYAEFGQLNTSAYIYTENNYAEIYAGNEVEIISDGYINMYTYDGNVNIYTDNGNGDIWISSYSGRATNINADSGEGDIYLLNGSNHLHINGETTITGSLIVSNGSGLFDSYLIAQNSDLSLTSGSNLRIEDNGHLYLGNGPCGDIYFDGDSGNVIFYNDCNNFEFRNNISVTGSITVAEGDTIYATNLNTYYGNGGDLNIESANYLYLYSDNQYVEISTYNNDNGTNYLWVEGTGVGFQTYDNTSDNNHTVFLYDNGNLDFTNVNVNISGATGYSNLQVGGNLAVTGSISSNGFYTDNIWGVTEITNSLHLNGGSLGAPDVELTSLGNISLFSEGGRGAAAAINMTGSVHITNDLDVSGSLHAGVISNYNGDINGGGIYIDSVSYTEISYNNEQNYLYVANDGLFAETNIGTNQFISNAGDTTITANNGYNVNINASNILLNGPTAVTGAFTVSSGSVTTLGGNLFVSGNLQVLGSQTNVNLESHTVNIGDNIILVNAYSPFQRYAGIAGYDSGSTGASGSLLWDSLNNYWNFVTNAGSSSKMIGTTAAALGSEISLTSGTFPIATGDDTIGDSLLTYSGTTLAYNTNKFTVDSTSGDVYIYGNVTMNGAGGSDNGSLTSQVVFRNSDDILGYVSTTDTLAVTTQLLGYDESDGTLKFSSVIDGGSY